MPLERVSKGFKDISMTFRANPLNNDLIVLKNENAVARAVRNLVMTYNGESPYNTNLGSEVSRSLFDNMDSLIADRLKDDVSRTIRNYEPRVSLISVNVDPDYDNNIYNVRIAYQIIGIDVPAQQLSFALKPNR